MVAGLLLGLVFQRLLHELGVDVSQDHALLSIVAFAFLGFVAFLFYPLFAFGTFQTNDISAFYGTDIFWFVVALLIGGMANLLISRVKK